MARRRRIDWQYLEALLSQGLETSEVSQITGVAPATIYQHIQRRPDLRAVIDEARSRRAQERQIAANWDERIDREVRIETAKLSLDLASEGGAAQLSANIARLNGPVAAPEAAYTQIGTTQSYAAALERLSSDLAALVRSAARVRNARKDIVAGHPEDAAELELIELQWVPGLARLLQKLAQALPELDD